MPQEIKNPERKRAEDIKKKIFDLEKKNDRYVYVFRSTKDWWKIGGNSALYYKYIVAPRIKIKPNLIRDSDKFSKFKNGVVSIRDIDVLKRNMRNARLELREENDNAMRFEFERPIESETLNSIKQSIEVQSEKVNQLVETNIVVPKMYTAMRTVGKRIWFYIKNDSDVMVRTVVGPKLIEDSEKLMTIYARLANGYIETKNALNLIMIQANDIIANMAFLYEVEAISYTRCHEIQDLLAEIKHLARNELSKIERKENDRRNK